jgi:hypothetical protein
MLLVPLLGLSQPTEKACFSVKGGFYEESPLLEIFPFYQQHHICFTINGNRPTAESRLYTEPLLLDNAEFCQLFNNRFHDLLNTVFSYENTAPFFVSIKETLTPEIPFQSYRCLSLQVCIL